MKRTIIAGFVGIALIVIAVTTLSWRGDHPVARTSAAATLTASTINFGRRAERQRLTYYLLPGHRHHLGPGDPHAILLREIEPVTRAVPSGSRLGYAQFFDAHTDSCDGVGSTEGWDGPDVQIEFTWHGPAAEILTYAARQMTALGWTTTETLNTTLGPEDTFTKRLAWGSLASGSLQPSDEPGPNWALSVQAAPDGRVVTGC